MDSRSGIASSSGGGNERTADLLPDVLSDRYRIQGQLGTGSISAVYEATELRLHRAVAIKILRSGRLTEPNLRKRFHREAAITARLSHPNIVSILDTGESSDGYPYMVMERVNGVTLAQLLLHGPLDIELAIDIGLQIARALRAAHRAGIMHRDLKPANVMLEALDGGDVLEGVHVRVVDFGLLKLMDDAPEEDDPELTEALTRAGVLMGTPAYVAPEQALCDQVDHRADLYALGVVMFEMIAGRPPFEGETLVELLTHHVQTVPLNLVVATDGGCPEALARVVERCLQKAPSDRFESADAVIRGLKQAWSFVADQSYGTEARFLTPTSDIGAVRDTEDRAPRPSRVWWLLIAVLIAVLIAGGIGVLGPAWDSSTAAVPEPAAYKANPYR